jgi:heterodisulfide reductase subunit C
MLVEIIFTVIIVAIAVFIFYKNLKKSTSGQCNCGSCSSSCPKYSISKEKK